MIYDMIWGGEDLGCRLRCRRLRCVRWAELLLDEGRAPEPAGGPEVLQVRRCVLPVPPGGRQRGRCEVGREAVWHEPEGPDGLSRVSFRLSKGIAAGLCLK